MKKTRQTIVKKLNTAQAVFNCLQAQANPFKAIQLAKYFQVKPGGYGEGDKFLGLTVPEMRKIESQTDLSYTELAKLAKSQWHEARYIAALHYVTKQEQAKTKSEMKTVAEEFWTNRRAWNNWDLIDTATPTVLGPVYGNNKKWLMTNSKSVSVWERRMAILATHYHIKNSDYGTILWLVEKMLSDKHDLIHKALGWMLREVEVRDGKDVIRQFIRRHGSKIPRTTLRYAIEHFDKAERMAILAETKEK